MRFQQYLKEETELHLANVTEYGAHFETGRPVTFPFTRGTVSSKKFGKLIMKQIGMNFQTDIEPAGRYMLHDYDPKKEPLPNWEKGTVTFKHPLVLVWSESGRYDETSWKANLYNVFGKKGKALSRVLKQKGYDGIVTVNKNSTSEIIEL